MTNIGAFVCSWVIFVGLLVLAGRVQALALAIAELNRVREKREGEAMLNEQITNPQGTS